MRYFLKKVKSSVGLWRLGALHHDPAILPAPVDKNVSKFAQFASHEKSIPINRIFVYFSTPSFYGCATPL